MTGSAAGVALGAWDDHPIHQTADLLAAPTPAVPGWTERFYFNGLRPSGEIAFIVGGGVYPARGIAECYLCRIDGDRQVNVRAWQAAGERSPRLEAGAFAFACTTPLRDWRVSADLGDDSFSGRFAGDTAPFLFREIDIPADDDGGPFDRFRHFVGLGRWALEDTPAIVDPEDLVGVRDRTWGVRTRRPRLHLWSVLRLGDAFLALKHQERADGRVHFSEAALTHPRGRVEPFAVSSHDLTFDPRERELRRAILELRGSEGALVVELEPVGRGIRLAGAGYDDAQGDRGSGEGRQRDEYDLADPELAARTGRGTIDIGVRARVSGSLDAEGTGVAETAIARDHVRYGAQVTPG